MTSHILPWWMPLSVFVWAVQMVVFHGVGYAFEYCDRTRTLRRCKVRDIDRKSYRQLMPRVLANQVFILLPCMVAMEAMGLAFAGAPEHLPLWRFLLSLVVMGVGHDIVQYATHRHLLHRPSLIRALKHSIHHSTGASKGISACFMSGPDFFLEIALPYLLPLALIGGGSDIVFHMTIAGLGAIGGVYEHSGYDFAVLLPKAKIAERMPRVAGLLGKLVTSHAHGQHHAKGNVSFSDGFGSPGVCDSVFGTRWDLAEDRKRFEPPTATLAE